MSGRPAILEGSELGVRLPGRRIGQRAGWLLLFLLILLAFFGAFGSGPLARASLSAPGGVRVEYSRVVRRLAPNEIRIQVAAASAPRERLELEVQQPPRAKPLAVSPLPLRERATAAGSRFELATRGQGPFEITLTGETRGLGWRAIQLAIDDGKPLSIRQLVLP
jgi:hypothetical protein